MKKIIPKTKVDIRVLKAFGKIVKNVAPNLPLKISEWTAKHRVLSEESSSESGRWNLDRAPYQTDMMDAITDTNTERAVFMTSAQVGKTEILLNIMGYFIDHEPSPILYLLPTKDVAESFSKDRIAPMIRDTPILRNKVQDAKSRNGDNTILHKNFPGGRLNIIGANAPANLASRPIRIVLMDEVDRFPESAGAEGDPVALAMKRTTTYWNRKIVMVSTPTIKGLSRIEKEYEKSTMEQWQVPCPRCGYFQALEWSRIEFPDEEYQRPTMKCSCCDNKFYESEWKEQFCIGKWVGRKQSKIRGFHLNELASPWKTWTDVISDFKIANKDGLQAQKVWINTSLGESWQELGDGANVEDLYARREQYDADLPNGVLILTAGVDIQDDRIEVEVVGWNRNYESWGIEYRKIFGDLSKYEPWEKLEYFLSQEFYFANGVGLNIAATAIDTGGHMTEETYQFLKDISTRRSNIFGIKGLGRDGVPFIHQVSKNNNYKLPIYIIGVNAGKESLLLRIKTTDFGAGYCHFPDNLDKGYDKTYFSGLTSEYRTQVKQNGRLRLKWMVRAGCRNEPFDLRNYATAALDIISPIAWEVLEAKLHAGENYMVSTKRKKGSRSGIVSEGIVL